MESKAETYYAVLWLERSFRYVPTTEKELERKLDDLILFYECLGRDQKYEYLRRETLKFGDRYATTLKAIQSGARINKWPEGMMVELLKKTSLIRNPSGKLNSYAVSFAMGLGGSVKEPTWNKKEKKHDCCQAKKFWRHKKACPRLK